MRIRVDYQKKEGLSKERGIEFEKQLQKVIVVEKLNVPAAASQLINSSCMLSAKHDLDALQTLDLPPQVVA